MSQYWFRKRQGLLSKDLGWGWVPISWEGWLATIVFLIVILGIGYPLGIYEPTTTFRQGMYYLLAIGAMTAIFARIAMTKTRPD